MQDIVPQYQPRDVTAEAPQQRVSPFLVARSGEQVGEGMQQLGAGLEQLAEPLAEQKGAADAQAAVTRAPDGTPQVATPQTSFIFGRAGDAYAAAVQSGETARLHTMMQSDFADMATKFQGDPQGFQKSAATYVQTLAGQQSSPVMQEQIGNLGNELAGQHYAGLVDQKGRADLASAQGGLEDRKALLETQMDSLASQQGGTDTPQFKQWQQERGAIQDDLANNPLFKYNSDIRQTDDANFESKLQGSSIAGAGRRMFQQTGDAVAARNYVEDHLNKVPGLDETKKIRLLGEVTAHLQGAQALQAQVRSDLENQASGLAAHMTTTGQVDDNTVDGLLTSLRGARAFKAAGMLEAARDQTHFMPLIVGGTAQQAIDALQKVQHLAANPPAAATVGGFNSAVSRTLGFEGGYNPNDANGSPSNLGINQAANPGVNVKSLTVDQAKGIYKTKYWDAIGGDQLDKDNPALAHVAFDTAVVAGPQKAKELMAESGGDANKFMDLRASYLNGLIANDPAKYSKYATAWATRDAGLRADIGSSSEVQPAFKQLVSTVQARFDQRGQQAFAQMQAAWKQGAQPTAQEVGDLLQMAPYMSDDKLREQIGETMQVQAAKAQVAGYPAAVVQSMAQAGQTMAAAGKLNAAQRLAVQGVAQEASQKLALAKNDPALYAVRYTGKGTAIENGYAAPVVPWGGDPKQVTAAIQQRQAAVTGAKSVDPAVTDGVLTTADRQSLASSLSTMSGQQAAATLSQLNGSLTAPQMAALVSDPGVKTAILGMSRSSDPQKLNAAYGFLDAQYKANPLQFEQTFGSGAEKDLRAWQAKIAFMTPEETAQYMQHADDPDQIAARAGLRDAAKNDVKGVSASDVISKFSTGGLFGLHPFGGGAQAPASLTPGITANALRNDYVANYQDGFEATGDKTQADQYAMQKLKQKWGVSDINGGRVMAFPPEKYVPQVGGSYDWMKKQLDDAWTVAVGSRGLSFDEGRQMIGEDHALVSDRKTQADVAAGRVPSYQIIYTDADGQSRLLETSPGSLVALRWRPDPKAAQDAALASAEAKDRIDRQFDLQPKAGVFYGAGD